MEKKLINDNRLTPTMERVRDGQTQLFREKNPNDRTFIREENADVILEPPKKELYAELIDGQWYWVNGCKKCTGEKGNTYIVCSEHDKCETCGISRKEIVGSAWGLLDGWQCNSCHEEKIKQRRIEAFEKLNGEDPDCNYTDKIKCPHCGTEIESSDTYEDVEGYECHVCNGLMDIDVHHSISYSTTVKGKRLTN